MYQPNCVHASYSGPGVPLGFANGSFTEALADQPQTGWGREFTAFVIEKDCPTFVHIGGDETID